MVKGCEKLYCFGKKIKKIMAIVSIHTEITNESRHQVRPLFFFAILDVFCPILCSN